MVYVPQTVLHCKAHGRTSAAEQRTRCTVVNGNVNTQKRKGLNLLQFKIEQEAMGRKSSDGVKLVLESPTTGSQW
ncbi:hypothetical protein Q1695_016345 [Nippostrongylus brasiliensis]|nr:hypothetical protein Q1695_016345 [Nippostrongylus brasiliensis]